jgi:Spy/CpxP family protein refolding chaperone
MRKTMMAAALACGLLAMHSVRGDEPATKPAKKADTSGVRRARMTKPWNQMPSLSAEQKEKILDIRTEANAERKRIDEEEREKIVALLTDEQKKELAEVEAADKK